jgi:hydrogenase maturation protease
VRVIGIGNPLRGDDAIGLFVARRVHELADPRVEVLELEGEPARLIDAWQGAGLAVVVDAVRSEATAGKVMRIDATAEPLPPSLSASSTHALGLGDAIEIARALNRLPPRLIVYAIEGTRFEAGSEVSPAVAAAVPAVAEAVLRELEWSDDAARPDGLLGGNPSTRPK